MMHFLRLSSLATLAVALTTLVSAGPADARTPVRGTQAAVTVRNAAPGWTLSVRLAPSTRLRGVSGGTAKGRRGTIAIRPRKGRTTLTVRTKGTKPPTAWRVGTTRCATKALKRRGRTARLTVTCVLRRGQTTPGGLPGAPGGTPAPGGSAKVPYRFAPYADMAGWPPPDLDEVRSESGTDRVSLGFVVQSVAGGCDPTWGGYVAYPATGAGAYRRGLVHAFRQGGGDVVVSFGGAAGTELALACSTVDELAAAYRAVIDAYGVTQVDFDIEGSALGVTDANTRRAQAIAKLQQADPKLVVTYTLPTETDGLTAEGRAALANAIANGVDITVVNVMTMDYTGVANPAGMMGAYAIQAGTALYGQLAPLYPALTAAERWRKVGVTPMIGINDVSTQVFTVQDARDVAAWATSHHIGMLGMWSLGRDAECATPVTTKQPDCSGVAQAKWDFAKALQAFAG